MSAEGRRSNKLEASTSNLTKYDGPAGLVVFLVALPLCLGIALASGAPLPGGIIAGVVGGIVVGIFSGSQVSVSGPAAGLAVIVAAAIASLGSYPAFLSAVVLAGILQFLFGVAKLGGVANYVPNSVIKGMLAGIGAVIILKQIPHAFGRDKDYEGNFDFLEAHGGNTLADIAESIASASPGAVIVSMLSLIVLVFWDKLGARHRFFKMLPGPLVVVALSILVNHMFRLFSPAFEIVEPEHLVNLSAGATAGGIAGFLTMPDFSALSNPKVWTTALTIAVVASIESLLSLEAADRLDPFRRISPPDRELRAQGVGNIVSGLLGGLPVTSVVVRTSANVYAGARTWMSTVIHGVFLLTAVLLMPSVLNLTPLASLAAILIVIGYKLTKPALYVAAYQQGLSQFVPFVVTVLAVVFIDLLKGVLIGLACGAFFVIRANHKEAISVVNDGLNYLMRFNKDATFVNKNEFRNKLRNLPEGASVVIDGGQALFIDHDIREVADDFKQLAPHKNIRIELKHWDGRAS